MKHVKDVPNDEIERYKKVLSYTDSFSEWLKIACILFDISGKDLAKEIGLSYGAVSCHLNGTQKPSQFSLSLYSAYFGIDVPFDFCYHGKAGRMY